MQIHGAIEIVNIRMPEPVPAHDYNFATIFSQGWRGHADGLQYLQNMNPENAAPQIIHDCERRVFEASRDGETAYLSYSAHGNRISLDHTFVPDSWRGRGVAGKLVQAAVDEARRKGWKLCARCSYVVTYFERHPECADVVA